MFAHTLWLEIFLSPTLLLQRKNFGMICLERKVDSITQPFIHNRILTEHDLSLYELLKLSFRSLNRKLSTKVLISVFSIKIFAYKTTILKYTTLAPPFWKTK